MRTWIVIAALSGFLAVAAGAFGAHGLEAMLREAADGPRRLEVYRTGAQYHLVHSVALLVVGLLPVKTRGLTVSRWCFATGIVVFSGSLYTLGLTGAKWLGAVTPLGGVAFLVGWAALTTLRLPARESAPKDHA